MKPDVSQIFKEIESLHRERTVANRDGFMSMEELREAYEEATGVLISPDTLRRRLRRGKAEGRVVVERRPRLNIADEPYSPICYKFVEENHGRRESVDTE
jgi:hypothetical protein